MSTLAEDLDALLAKDPEKLASENENALGGYAVSDTLASRSSLDVGPRLMKVAKQLRENEGKANDIDVAGLFNALGESDDQ